MANSTLSDDNAKMRTMLRYVAPRFGNPPQELAEWWANEQLVIAQEEADDARHKAERSAVIRDQIAKLQTELAGLGS